MIRAGSRESMAERQRQPRRGSQECQSFPPADELLHMTDWCVDELFALPAAKAVTVAYPVSRLVCDPERFENDEKEPMAARGMGVIYTATHELKQLRRQLQPAERERLLERYYRPHHRRLTAAVAGVLAAEGTCLIVDAHSFPSVRLPYEDELHAPRPAICLGADEFHTPKELRSAAADAFSAPFPTVTFDHPFAGALVPAEYYKRDTRVRSIMVEVNRGLYMDETTGEKLASFGEMARPVPETVRRLATA
jgi:N-formylglutamate deformylase